MAAHCGGQGAKGSFVYQNETYAYTVDRSPLYQSGKDHDLALAFLDKDFPGPYASVSMERPEVGDAVILSGYGCTNPGGGGGNDGILRYGDSEVSRYSGSWDVVTYLSGGGGAALCFGDSGGPAWIELEKVGSGEKEFKTWGVNSKGNISDTSYIAHFGNQDSKDFFQAFVGKHSDTEICGFNKDCSGAPPGDTKTFDNTFVKLVCEDKPDGHNPDYTFKACEMAALYLETGAIILPKPGSTAPTSDICSCGIMKGEEWFAVCDSTGFAKCANLPSKYCKCE
jgi:hypothetical protein